LPELQELQEEALLVRLLPELTAFTSEIRRLASVFPQLGQEMGWSAWLKARSVSNLCWQD
jgi:hypothetical protein